MKKRYKCLIVTPKKVRVIYTALSLSIRCSFNQLKPRVATMQYHSYGGRHPVWIGSHHLAWWPLHSGKLHHPTSNHYLPLCAPLPWNKHDTLPYHCCQWCNMSACCAPSCIEGDVELHQIHPVCKPNSFYTQNATHSCTHSCRAKTDTKNPLNDKSGHDCLTVLEINNIVQWIRWQKQNTDDITLNNHLELPGAIHIGILLATRGINLCGF